MSVQREELAIRDAFARRDAAGMPAGLWARLARIPDEVEPLRPLPVRLALGIAPWAGVIAAGLVIAFGPRILAEQGAMVGAPADTTWSAADPGGGLASVGIFGVPWAWLAVLLAVLGLGWVVPRVLRGERPVPAFGRGGRPRPRQARGRAVANIAWLVLVVVMGYMLFAVVGVGPSGQRDPIVYGWVTGPGPEVSEVTHDGLWLDETGGAASPSVERDVYRVAPGEPFTFLTSVRNIGLVPITILGLPGESGLSTEAAGTGRAFGWTGLALMRDPRLASAHPKDVVPFHPVTLAPGEEVAILVAAVGGACADRAAPVGGTGRASGDEVLALGRAPGVPLVYDVFGWRRIGVAYPPAHVTVPVRSGCLGDGS